MLESFPMCILVGATLGFLSGLGIGGGSLLLVWLTAVLHTDPIAARNINLMFFLPAALTACIVRRKNRHLAIRIAIPAIITGCIFAVAGYFLSTRLETGNLKKMFGLILIITGLKDILYRPRKAR